MVDALEPLQVDRVTCSDRCRGVTITLVDRHNLVLDPMEQSRRDADWQQFVRRRDRVTLRHVGRRAAQEPDNRATAKPHGRALHEVENARLSDDAPDMDRWLRTWGVSRELVTPSQPHRKLPAGRMPDSDDALEVETAIGSRVGDGGKCVNGPGDVEQRRGKAAAVANAAVLDVPGGYAVLRDIGCETSTERPTVARAPISAVDHDDNRPRCSVSVALSWEVKIGDLTRIGPVCQGQRRRPLGSKSHDAIQPR